LSLLLIPLISFLDWLRGQGKPEGTGTIKKLLLGLAMSFAMGLSGSLPVAFSILGYEINFNAPWILIGTVLCAASFANGWGAALGSALRKDGSSMGPKYENYWQSELVNRLTFGLVRSNPLFAMAVRGVWGFLFVAPLVYFNIYVLILLPVFALSFSLPTLLTDNWKTYEKIRGACLGAGCVLIGYLIS